MAAGDGRRFAVISATGCKGCGGCVPVCPDDAIDLLGYSDAQVRAQIDSLLRAWPSGGLGRIDRTETLEIREVVREEMAVHGRILEAVKEGPRTMPEIAEAVGYPTHEVVFWVMGMRRYGWLSEVEDRPAMGTSGTRRRGGMTALADIGLYPELQRYGATDIERLLQLRQLHRGVPALRGGRHVPTADHPVRPGGHAGRTLLSSKELWACYHCGECSDTCPQAG